MCSLFPQEKGKHINILNPYPFPGQSREAVYVIDFFVPRFLLGRKTGPKSHGNLAHQNRTIAIASDFRVDGAKSPEIPQKEWVLGSEIAARNRKSLATFHRTLKSQCSIAFSCLRNRAISGVRDGHRNRKSQKSREFGALSHGNKFKLEFGSSRPKSTLQGSGLEGLRGTLRYWAPLAGTFVNSVHTRGILKTRGFTGAIGNTFGDSIRFQGCRTGIPTEQERLRKSKPSRTSTEKWTFLSLAFYSLHAICTLLIWVTSLRR